MNRDAECGTVKKASANHELLSSTLKHKVSYQEGLHDTFTGL